MKISPALLLLAAQALAAPPAGPDTGLHIPFEKYKLSNGLRVVLARDATVPLTAVYLIYETGARTEDKGHTGYAHLIERLMFDGSAHVKKGEFEKLITAGGGEFSGATHLDYSDYYEVLPSNRLALALWLESDRMQSLALTEENLKLEKDALKQERREAFDAQPYKTILAEKWPAFIFGAFPNTHSTAGSPEDLDKANIEDLTKFYRAWYTPNNAVLTISGDFDSAEAKRLVAGYFGDIASPAPAKRPDTAEAPRTEGRRVTVQDPSARLPAVIVGWPAPARHSPDWYAVNAIDALLTSGESARLRLDLMQGGQALVGADANLGWPLASPSDFRLPADYAAILIHRPNYSAQEILDQYQKQIDRIADQGVVPSEMARIAAYFRLSSAAGAQTALGRAKLLAIHELLDGDAGLAEKDAASQLEVTSGQMRAAAKKYLTAARRDVMIVETGIGKP